MSDDEDNNFEIYGTILEPFDEDSVQKKKAFTIEDQIATDDRGRRRFHGAFTGGFSAGFFNTVGSLEGWLPAEYKSSRSEKSITKVQRVEDFMDDEDISEFGIAPKVLRATSDYSNIQKRTKTSNINGPIPGIPVLESLIRPAKDTVGVRLLKCMGWKPGQGIGPRLTKSEKKKMNKQYKKNSIKVYGCEIPEEFRQHTLSNSDSNDEDEDLENVTFAPDDYDPFIYKPKDNTFGMGYVGLIRRSSVSSKINNLFTIQECNKKKISITGQAFGVGAFEDEDDDIYSYDDMSKYDFELKGLSGHKKQIKNKGKQKKQTGEFIIQGFVNADNQSFQTKIYSPPVLPKNFIPKHGARISRFEPLPETHKYYNYDRKKQIGRHDISANERRKIINFEPNLILNSTDSQKDIRKISNECKNLPEITKQLTQPLPSTSTEQFKPFINDVDKQKRYETYLELIKKNEKKKLSDLQPISMSDWEREKEKTEFEQASCIFKSSSTSLIFDKFVTAGCQDDITNFEKSIYLHGTQELREAAQKKMFGPLTRNVIYWKPNKLLCKRFNVPDPVVDIEQNISLTGRRKKKFSVFDYYENYQKNKIIVGPTPKPLQKPEDNKETVPDSTQDNIKSDNNIESTRNVHNIENEKKEIYNNNIVTENKFASETEKVEIVTEIKITSIIESTSLLHSEILSVQEIDTEEKNTKSKDNTRTVINIPQDSNKISNKKKDNKDLVVDIPQDSIKKMDLFKAIFLSSSDESESDSETLSKKEEKIIEMKQTVLENPIIELNTINERSNRKGFFADLDLESLKKTTEHNETVILDSSLKKCQMNDDNVYGPKLPTEHLLNLKLLSDQAVKNPTDDIKKWIEKDYIKIKSVKKKKKHKHEKLKHKKHKTKKKKR